ncbi:MAG: S8 family serine peptidase [Planctomycetota bacterium]
MRFALAFSLLAAVTAAQQPTFTQTTTDDVVPDSYVVVFANRSFTLDAFREAVHQRRPAGEIDAIVRGLESAVERDQADFVRDVRGLGGDVVGQYWIINGACVDRIAADKVEALRRLPNVKDVQPNRVYTVVNNTARNATHHEADQANLRQTTGGAFVTGTGVAVAVLDTGADRLFQTTGRPNPAYYIGGNQSNTQGGGLNGSRLLGAYGVAALGNVTEDGHSHGTHVSGSVASDYPTYRGMAPGAHLVSIKVASDGGAGNTNTIVQGWQLAASRAVADNILVANNSMSGSPSLTDPIQMALDSAAYNSDILCCVAAGNNGANTTASQNAWNGLAVGALNKNSLTVASFSCTGPLASFGRTYPDISAVGVSVVSTLIDSTGGASFSGTSMASPMVAGGAACVRQVDPAMTATEAKAILLARTKHVQTSRNTYGLGMLDIDASVGAALQHDFGTARLTAAAPVWRRQFSVGSGQQTIAIAWMHPPGSTIDNLDLRLRDSNNNVVGQDLNTLNSYEKINYVVFTPGTFTAEVTWVNATASRNVDFAISGVGSLLATQPPTLTAIAPTSVTNPTPGVVTLDGTLLDTINRITVAGTDITSFTVLSPTQVQFAVPGPFDIGTHNVTASNTAGTSNAMQLTVDGVHPMVLSAPPFSARGFPTDVSGVGDKNWVTVLFTSTNPAPSNWPGVVSLDMGNNFAELFQLAVLTNDNRGTWGVTLNLPTSLPAGIGLLFQAITIDPFNPVPPIENSNRGQTTFF